MASYIDLPYTADSSVLFEPIAEEPWAIYLDSCFAPSSYQHKEKTRYDILTAHPAIKITTHSDYTTHITYSNQKTEQTDQCPFEVVQHVLKTCPYSPLPEDLPFNGGAMGYFGYELAYQLYPKLTQSPQRDISFPDMAIGLYEWAVIVDHHRKRTVLCLQPTLSQTDRKALTQKWLNLSRHNKPTESYKQPQPSTLAPMSEPFTSNMSKRGYIDRFKRVKDHITAGDCYQVNLAQRFKAKTQAKSWALYRQLRQYNPAPYAAFMNFEFGAVLSLSPEQFLRVKGDTVTTRPIKGTRPRHPDPHQDRAYKKILRHSEKDLAENLMIVDLLRNDLSKTCRPGTVKVPELFTIESFPQVHHLVSTVTGILQSDVHPLTVLRHAFPGGSITGVPKLRAMQIIGTLEPHHRSVYCGSIGYITSDGCSMDTNITIRTLIHRDPFLYTYTGGGLVYDSTAEEEYQETWDKIGKILSLLSP